MIPLFHVRHGALCRVARLWVGAIDRGCAALMPAARTFWDHDHRRKNAKERFFRFKHSMPKHFALHHRPRMTDACRPCLLWWPAACSDEEHTVAEANKEQPTSNVHDEVDDADANYSTNNLLRRFCGV